MEQQMRTISSAYGDQAKAFKKERKGKGSRGSDNGSRNSMSAARRSSQNKPTRQYVDVQTSKATKALPA